MRLVSVIALFFKAGIQCSEMSLIALGNFVLGNSASCYSVLFDAVHYFLVLSSFGSPMYWCPALSSFVSRSHVTISDVGWLSVIFGIVRSLHCCAMVSELSGVCQCCSVLFGYAYNFVVLSVLCNVVFSASLFCSVLSYVVQCCRVLIGLVHPWSVLFILEQCCSSAVITLPVLPNIC